MKKMIGIIAVMFGISMFTYAKMNQEALNNSALESHSNSAMEGMGSEGLLDDAPSVEEGSDDGYLEDGGSGDDGQTE